MPTAATHGSPGKESPSSEAAGSCSGGSVEVFPDGSVRAIGAGVSYETVLPAETVSTAGWDRVEFTWQGGKTEATVRLNEGPARLLPLPASLPSSVDRLVLETADPATLWWADEVEIKVGNSEAK